MNSEYLGEHGYVHVARYTSFRRQLRVWKFNILRWALWIVCESLLDLGDVRFQAIFDSGFSGSLELLLFALHCMVKSTPFALEVIDMFNFQHAIKAGIQ